MSKAMSVGSENHDFIGIALSEIKNTPQKIYWEIVKSGRGYNFSINIIKYHLYISESFSIMLLI